MRDKDKTQVTLGEKRR